MSYCTFVSHAYLHLLLKQFEAIKFTLNCKHKELHAIQGQTYTVPCINNWSFHFLQTLFAQLCSDPKWKFCIFVKLQLATTWIYCSLYTLKTHKNDYLGILVSPHYFLTFFNTITEVSAQICV